AQPDAQGQKLLRDAAETMKLPGRGYHRVLRVARTLADLDGAEKIGRLHLAEALSYRALAEDLRRAAWARLRHQRQFAREGLTYPPVPSSAGALRETLSNHPS